MLVVGLAYRPFPMRIRLMDRGSLQKAIPLSLGEVGALRLFYDDALNRDSLQGPIDRLAEDLDLRQFRHFSLR